MLAGRAGRHPDYLRMLAGRAGRHPDYLRVPPGPFGCPPTPFVPLAAYLSGPYMPFSPRPSPVAPPATSDQELLACYRLHADPADLGLLYDRHLPDAFAVCRRYLAPPDEDAEDAVMQLFEVLLDKLKTHAPANFGAWLYATARNFCLMALRARQRSGPRAGPRLLAVPEARDMEILATRHLPDDAETTEVALETEATLQALEHALGQLPPAQRRCLELFFMEGYSYQQIATALELDLGLVKSHLQNGRRMLRKTVSGC